MKSLLKLRLLIISLPLLLAAGCKEPETVIVNQSPTAMSPSDTTESSQPATNEASFRKLVIGEFEPINSLDPLFADNAAAMRAVQLTYEGLVRFDANGAIVPGLAKDWSVKEDSLEYTFHLRPQIYYQDSQVFETGKGRRMTSSDVKFVFERMAHADVPPKAANMFMAIKNFEPYFQEQHLVYNPQNRKLNSISGIQTPNDTTVVFQLITKDSTFLKKLATPLAVIYPREAVGSSVDSFSPVGAGPFNFVQRASDSTYIFSRFQNYYDASDVDLNRVDIIANKSEGQLFRAMGEGDIYLLPQLGPQLFQNLLDGAGNLVTSYSNRYKIQRPAGSTVYVLRYNPHSNLPLENARDIVGMIPSDTSSYFQKFPDALVQTDTLSRPEQTRRPPVRESEVFSAFSDDPFVRTFLGNLSKTLISYQTTIKMMDIRTPTRDTGLFFTVNLPVIPASQWDNYRELFRFRVRQVALQRNEVQGLEFNSYPWWFNPRGVTLPAEENLN